MWPHIRLLFLSFLVDSWSVVYVFRVVACCRMEHPLKGCSDNPRDRPGQQVRWRGCGGTAEVFPPQSSLHQLEETRMRPSDPDSKLKLLQRLLRPQTLSTQVLGVLRKCSLDCGLIFYTFTLSVILNPLILVLLYLSVLSASFFNGIIYLAIQFIYVLHFGDQSVILVTPIHHTSPPPPPPLMERHSCSCWWIIIPDRSTCLPFDSFCFSFRSDVRASTLRLWGPGRRGALFFWGGGDSPP